MTKKEIVRDICERANKEKLIPKHNLTQLATKEIVQWTFEAIIDTLVEDSDHRIELRNFGVFEVKKRAARKARNPRTGSRVDVPEKYVVTFKPGKEMEERVLQLQEAAQASVERGVDVTTPERAGGRGQQLITAGIHSCRRLAGIFRLRVGRATPEPHAADAEQEKPHKHRLDRQ